VYKMNPDVVRIDFKSFQPHLSSTIKKLFKENTHADVTLVSDDQKQIAAHKFVLSACSPALGNLLISHPHAHPLLYMRGVKHQELELITQFMYCGEVEINTDRMNEFMELAIDLQIDDFIQYKQTCRPSEQNKHMNIKEQNALDELHTDLNMHNKTNCNDTSDQIAFSNQFNTFLNSGNVESVEEKPGESTIKSSLYPCSYCSYRSTRKGDLKKHQQYKHEGIRYSCNKCDYKATIQANLRRHKQSTHEGIRYSCNQCDYKATQMGRLKEHQKSKHEGFRYSCNQCSFQGTQNVHLKEHIKSKHEGVRYPCDRCEYQAPRPSGLKRHQKNSHNMV